MPTLPSEGAEARTSTRLAGARRLSGWARRMPSSISSTKALGSLMIFCMGIWFPFYRSRRLIGRLMRQK